MKSVPRLIRWFVGILLLSCFLLILLNIGALAMIMTRQAPNASPWKTAQEAAQALEKTDEGYTLPSEMGDKLKKEQIWAIFIENTTMQVVWHTKNLPDTIPLAYDLAGISNLTRKYIDGYPTFPGERADGLMVLGYPKTSYWKHIWPSWDYSFIAHLPQTALIVIGINVAVIFLIYFITTSRVLKSVGPIADGIQDMGNGKTVRVSEKGLLCELAAGINRTSAILQSQNHQLRKKEMARANWIAGVSHDIRTPLSMVMGYAGQLMEDERLPKEAQEKASVILTQSKRMRNLINDLNLSSKLEYNMQPVHPKKENAVAIVRQVAVDFMNLDIEEKYPIYWETERCPAQSWIYGDKDLLKRAVSNLIQNCMNHNEKGCHIYVSVKEENMQCVITVADDGEGIPDEQLAALNNMPHYMVCDEEIASQRHGLGLRIVRQIMASHQGEAILEHSSCGGFAVRLLLLLYQGQE